MTCIVGYVEDGTVYMGSDSAGSDWFTYTVRQEPKVFKRPGDRGEMIIGYTSSFRFGQLLEHALEIPIQPKNMNDHKYMVTSFMDAVRKCLGDGGFKKTKNDNEQGGTCLIGYHGKLWEMEDDFQIALCQKIGASVGSGVYAATAVLHILDEYEISPKKKVEKALQIAEKCVTTVKGPFKIISGAKE